MPVCDQILNIHILCRNHFLATQNIDIGVNISEDLEQLKSNLNKFKNSNMGGSLLDMDIQQLDWVEDNKKVKAFIIYESSV